MRPVIKRNDLRRKRDGKCKKVEISIKTIHFLEEKRKKLK